MRLSAHHCSFGATLALGAALFTTPALAQGASGAYRDIEDTLGSVPTFFKLFPQQGSAAHGPSSRPCSSTHTPRYPARRRS